ncbi:hypothetical protein C8F04DRAFT_1269214 [Mycena alexandri]|uniref:Uncharacterized protein n=1 Tax=Mycena alexandri TaxID=1745969 RepID=A0AAD6SDY4_9AGAR|nr:hypothetical protein C8F04DRAFT_1269214 [Mycena alexandri]
MDASAIGRFHSTVQPIPLESLEVPAGGLGHFLRQNLRFKVFLVSMSVLEDRWGTRTRNSVTAKELHDLRVCVRLIVDHMAPAKRASRPFDGDDAPDMQGVSVFGLALSQAEFFLKECAEAIALYRLTDTPVFFDYQEYDPQHTVEMVFASRQPPRNYKRIAVNDNPVLDFSVKPSGPYWTDAQRVVEATLMALSRIDGALIVEMDSDGSVVGIQKESVEGILADMKDLQTLYPGALALLCARMKKPADAKPRNGSACVQFHVFITSPGKSSWRSPQTRLDGNFYPITESCELVIKHCRVASARFEPGNPDRERLDDVMECIIRPSVYILDCALRPANRDWLTPQELTMSELIYLHDAFSMVMAALFHLLEEGGQSFLNDGIRTNAGVYAPYVAFRGGCLRGLERLDEMLRQYLPESSTRDGLGKVSRISKIFPPTAEGPRLSVPPVSDRTMGQLEILEYMVEVYGFDGENLTEGRQMLAALEHLKRVATCWAALLGTRGEYPEFVHSGRMMRRPGTTGWVVPSSA